MARKSGFTSNQTGGGKHGKDDGKGGGDRRARDAGAPEQASGRRASRRAEHTQVVSYGPFGGVRVKRNKSEGNLADRWRH